MFLTRGMYKSNFVSSVSQCMLVYACALSNVHARGLAFLNVHILL